MVKTIFQRELKDIARALDCDYDGMFILGIVEK